MKPRPGTGMALAGGAATIEKRWPSLPGKVRRPVRSGGPVRPTPPGQNLKCAFRARARSVCGVPAFRKWNERPRQMIVVGGFPRVIGPGRTMGRGPQGRSHGIQQSIELSLAHRALQVRARRDFDYNDRGGSCAHRNFPQNYRHGIAGYDRVFLIAANGREIGSFPAK